MNKENKIVSVLMLSYNNLDYFEEAISSVLDQTYENIELIISDDGSCDFNEKEILDFLASNNEGNIKKIVINHNEKNIGVVRNYNKAISLSSGEYIFYLAIDDVFYDNKVLGDVVDYFNSTGELIFTGYKDVYDVDLKKYIKTLPRANEVEFLKKNNPELLYEKLCLGSFISGSNTPFDRRIIDEYGYLDEKYYYLEDYPKYLKLTKQGCNISFFDRKLIKYRLGGVTTNGDINEFLRKDLRLATINECRDYFELAWHKLKIDNKKIIGWGIGDCFVSSVDDINNEIAYLVDSNKDNQNKIKHGLDVYSPEKILEEDFDNIFVFVFSYANYFDISSVLESYGLKETENFFCCNPTILEIVKA